MFEVDEYPGWWFRPTAMKKLLKRSFLSRVCVAALGVGLAVSSVSCMTTYDVEGRPMQTVDPGLAIAGVAAAGVLGYAIANNNHNNHHRHYHGGGYGYHRGYGRHHY
jgi:hypothetical protein